MATRPATAGSGHPLLRRYHAYLDCLNARDWTRLGDHVAADVSYNATPIGLGGYADMLIRDVEAIPDLRFVPGLLAVDPPVVAARLDFDCTPVGQFLGIAVEGRRIAFTENVFYRYEADRIAEVWSVIDKAAIEAQLSS